MSHIKDLANPAVDRVLIYAGDGRCYWKQGGCGYASALSAGVFTRAEAYELAGHCGPEKRIELHDVPGDHIPTLHAKIADLERRLADSCRDVDAFRDRYFKSQNEVTVWMERAVQAENRLAEAEEDSRRLRVVRDHLLAYGENNECTAHPWWAIVRKNGMGTNAILAGPFFSREAAENHRKAREYDYGKSSIVFCFSGHWSRQYKEIRAAIDAARKGGGE